MYKKDVTPESDRIGSIAHNSFSMACHSPIQLTFKIDEKHNRRRYICVQALDYFLRTLRDSPTEPFSDNSVNRRIEEASHLMLWRALLVR